MEDKKKLKVSEDKLATEFLANERTFLAWIRTSVVLISLGFIVARFSLWLHELAGGNSLTSQPPAPGASLPIGLSMVAAGGVFAILAAWRYHSVNVAIEQGAVKPDRALIVLVASVVVLVSAAMVVYMVLLGRIL